MRRRRREELVVDVWKLFDITRRALSDAWVDDVAPPRAIVEQIIEDTRTQVGRRLRRTLLQKRWLGRRLRPKHNRMAAAQPDPRRL